MTGSNAQPHYFNVSDQTILVHIMATGLYPDYGLTIFVSPTQEFCVIEDGYLSVHSSNLSWDRTDVEEAGILSFSVLPTLRQDPEN